MIDLRPDHLETVKDILARYAPDVEVRAFGSRVTWTAKDHSDLDLALVGEGEIDPKVLHRLQEAFADSDLPFRVNVVDWARISEGFRQIIEQQYEVIQRPGRKEGMGGERLADIAEIVMGQSPPGDTCNTDGHGVPLLNGPTEFGPHHPSPIQFTMDARKRARVGDILFCVRGSTTGRMNWADREYAIGRGVAAIRHKKDLALQPFLRAVIEHSLPTLLAQATGSTFPNVAYAQLASIPAPPLEEDEQRAIAHILGTLDDKIELNRRMNETLEAMARAIFKSWFVDFGPVRAKAEGRDPLPAPQSEAVRQAGGLPPHLAALFPDRFEDSELGEIPAGWQVANIDDEFNLTMGQSPPGESYNEVGNGIPFYQGRADFGFRSPKVRVFCTAPTRFADAGDTLVSVRAPVGSVNMAAEKCCVGRGVAATRHKSGSRSYTYYFMRSLEPEFTRFEAEGTVFGSISKADFHAIECVAPPGKIVKAFEKIVCPIDQQIENNEKQSRTLAALRDALLPKLLSGEIRVREAEHFLEARGL